MIHKTHRLTAILAVLFSVAGPLATNAKAQGSRKDDIVLNSRGQGLAGAMVRICASNATTTSPCTPLAAIYSDVGLTQPLANPITADGLGNYSFYAAPGRYVIEISGPGITTRQTRDVILPTDPSMAGSSALTGFSLTLGGGLTVGGNAAVTGSLNVSGAPVPSTAQANTWTANQTFSAPITLNNAGGNVAQKYACANGNIQYVDPANGNDANDGCSPGTAKQYLATAWTTLYTGNSTCSGNGNNACGGTIFTTDNSDQGAIYWDSAHHTARIIGPNDPNANWRITCGGTHATCVIGGTTWYSQLNGVHVVGVGCGIGGTGTGEKPKCNYGFGVGDPSGIGLQISGTNSPMTWENIAIQGAKLALAIGKDSNGNWGQSNTAENGFRNYAFQPSNANAPGFGPGVMLSFAFENYFYDGAVSGNYAENVATTSCTRASNVVTCTTPTNTTLQNGDFCYMHGQADPSFQMMGGITVVNSTTFTYNQTGPNISTTGGHIFTYRSMAFAAVSFGGTQGAPYIVGDLHISNGGVMIQGMGAGGVYLSIDHIVAEALPNDAAFLVVDGFTGSQVTIAGMTDLAIADSGTNVVSQLTFAGEAGFSRQQSAAGYSIEKEGSGFNYSMEGARQVGFEGTKVAGEWDGLFRAAAPALAQLSQYVVSNTNPGHWFGGVAAGYPALSSINVTGPDGFADAGQTNQNIAPAGTGSQAVTDGDIVIAFGMWEAPNGLSPTGGTGGIGASNHPFIFSTGGGCNVFFQDITGDGTTMGAGSGVAQFGGNRSGTNPVTNWERGFGVFKLRGSGTCSNIHWEAIADSTHPVALYMPMMYYIPAGTISDAEAASIAYYGSAAPFQLPSKVAWTPAWLYGRRLGVIQQYANGVGATPLTSSDFSLSGWGTSASVGSISGTDQGFVAIITAGSSPSANPSFTLTYHDGAWPNAPIFSCSAASGGTGTPQLWLISTTTTTLVATYNGTPAGGSTYPVSCVGIGR